MWKRRECVERAADTDARLRHGHRDCLTMRPAQFGADFSLRDGLPIVENNRPVHHVHPSEVVFVRRRSLPKTGHPHKDYFGVRNPVDEHSYDIY